MTEKQKPYHRGDLRETIVGFAIEEVERDGVAGLSLRKIAKLAGVSHNAPYMHFGNRDAFIAAVAQEGFRRLSARIGEAYGEPAPDWPARFEAGCHAYVAFALKRPALFTLMFSEFDPDQYPSLMETSVGSFKMLIGVIEEGQQSGHLGQGAPHLMAMTVWTCLHGMASIMAARRSAPLVFGGQQPRQLLGGLLQTLLRGIAEG